MFLSLVPLEIFVIKRQLCLSPRLGSLGVMKMGLSYVYIYICVCVSNTVSIMCVRFTLIVLLEYSADICETCKRVGGVGRVGRPGVSPRDSNNKTSTSPLFFFCGGLEPQSGHSHAIESLYTVYIRNIYIFPFFLHMSEGC